MSSAQLPAEGYQLKDISARAFQHPADRAATAALASVPYLDRVVRKLIELGYERALRQAYLGSAVRLSEDQLGDVWREHMIAYRTLHIEQVPDLYLTQLSEPNAFAAGSSRPIVVVNSELVRILDKGQRRAVFAHEAAHILSDHMLYRTALIILVLLTRSARLPLPLAPVRTALMEWSRATELSADRAAAVVTRDPLTVCRALMSLSGGTMVDELDLDVFMRQGLDYTEKGTGLERLTRLMLDLGLTHPMPVKRTHELMKWVRSGDFDRIVGHGEYPRRGDPVDARADGGEAVSFYAERAREGLREAAEQVNAVGQQLADWLRGSGSGRDDGSSGGEGGGSGGEDAGDGGSARG
jgi:Zn-dependent protease with chaperone function